ncbi:hypothetical protein [Tautonia plasticadhaerens]|uniref:Uncharacterized protein n=1 Tax=Tautonia plasticadhaerens TaxID=2527974 RepID=A0A518GZM6_9BACT|nr:hypothetical protein [Tautonia plasticadhaerens]QDV34033.1 hypothetical protein ElP_19140 [Tautonia plasticadhaerens]
MLVLKRNDGQWVELVHRSGDVIRVKVYGIEARRGQPGRANLAFDDEARNFEIRRPERRPLTPVNAPGPEADAGFEPAASAELAPFDPFTFCLQSRGFPCPDDGTGFPCPADDDLPDPGDCAVS